MYFLSKLGKWERTRFTLILLVAALAAQAPAAAGVADPVVVRGPQRLLVVAVRFPGTDPSLPLPRIAEKVGKVGEYIRTASYGKAWLEAKVTGWYGMPGPLSEYRVSPFNYKVDKGRVRRLVADALAAVRRDADLGTYRVIWIVVGAFTRPGEGYGMIAYCANPGMLSGVLGAKPALEAVDLPGGGSFSGPVIVSAENAHSSWSPSRPRPHPRSPGFSSAGSSLLRWSPSALARPGK